MFGAFKPSAPLSGGLLWKIPWRLSSNQKLRHRRRLRRVDNVVAVLDSALQRHLQSTAAQPTQPSLSSPDASTPQPPPTGATTSELASTAQGQRILNASANAALSERRHGRGPREGDILTGSVPHGKVTTLADEARRTGTVKLIERWKAEMPTEAEMLPRDKYSMFDRKAKNYRKGVHKLPKWTRVSQRLNPPGF